jgi:ligand-binding SRPBCC domain-containing protein
LKARTISRALRRLGCAFALRGPGASPCGAARRSNTEFAWLGFPVHWKTIILKYDPPCIFEDEEARGPYAVWRHRHTFEEIPGGVIISDYVKYALPFGLLGRIAHAMIVRRQLRQIFEFRQRALSPLLGGDSG